MEQKSIDTGKYYKVLVAILLLLCIASISTCSRKNAEIDNYEQNQKALNDSIEWVKTKEGVLEAQKALLIADNKALKELNSDLQNELKEERGKVVYITKTETTIKHDTITVYSEIGKDGKFCICFDTVYSKGNSRDLKIECVSDGTSVASSVVRDEFSMALVTGIKREDGVAKIFVRSDYPGFSVSSLEGAVLSQDDPIFSQDVKKKKFILGPQVGVGVTRSLELRPYVGIGLTYKIIAF